MAENLKASLTPVAMSPQAAAALSGAAGNDPTYSFADLEREIRDGTATLYEARVASVAIGFVVLWIDDFGSERELVWQSGKALSRDKEAVKVVAPLLDELARRRGCRFIRSHAQGSRQVNLLRSAGFSKAEIVMRKAVPNGR